jgi:U3 small nucleolar RNA-associated protein 22
MNVVGSYALGSMMKAENSFCLDFVVTMPRSIFQEKDYLNYRYFLKRAYYLSCIASTVRQDAKDEFDVQFSYLHGNYLLPILVLQPCLKRGSLGNLQIQIILATHPGTFDDNRLLPMKNCIREDLVSDQSVNARRPTPFYNASILVDSLITSYLKLQHETIESCETFLD